MIVSALRCINIHNSEDTFIFKQISYYDKKQLVHFYTVLLRKFRILSNFRTARTLLGEVQCSIMQITTHSLNEQNTKQTVIHVTLHILHLSAVT